MPTAPSIKPAPSRGRMAAFDRHVGARIVERRIALGLTQQRFAKLIGVSYQQVHKYEKALTGFRPVSSIASRAHSTLASPTSLRAPIGDPSAVKI